MSSSLPEADVEIVARTLLEADSWIDWWFDVVKTLVMRDSKKAAKVQCLIVAGIPYRH